MRVWTHVRVGYFGSKDKACKCTEFQIKNYRSRISGPILDRIDIQVQVSNIKYDGTENRLEESSKTIRERVNKARKIQNERYKKYDFFCNSDLNIKLKASSFQNTSSNDASSQQTLNSGKAIQLK